MASYNCYIQHSFTDYLRDPNYMPPPQYRPAAPITALAAPVAPAVPAVPAAPPAPPQSAPPNAASESEETERRENSRKRRYESSSEESEETAGEESMGPWLTPEWVRVRHERSKMICNQKGTKEEEEEEEKEEEEEEEEEEEDEKEVEEEEATDPAGSLPSVHQHQSSHQFEHSQSHSCCTDSMFESDTSFWDMSRDHDLEGEIVFAYDLPDLPRTAAEIFPRPASSNQRDGHAQQPREIDEDDFASWFKANSEEGQKERAHWNIQLCQETSVSQERWEVYVAYLNKCEAKRKAREDKKRKRTPSHEEKRLQKKKLKVRAEVERMRKSIEEKGKEAWDREHCDPEMKEAVKEEVKKFKLYGWAMPD